MHRYTIIRYDDGTGTEGAVVEFSSAGAEGGEKTVRADVEINVVDDQVRIIVRRYEDDPNIVVELV